MSKQHHLGIVLSDLFSQQQIFIIDAMPVPACKRVRRKRCKKVQGKDYEGYCASKKEYFFSWHLHLVCDCQGIPVAFELLPAGWDELVPVQHLLADLPEGALVVADKGYISYPDELLAYINGNIPISVSFPNIARTCVATVWKISNSLIPIDG